MTWATVEDVLHITRKAVDADLVAVAGASIEPHAGRVYDLDADRIGARDRHHLKAATAWQAAWLADQPGYTARHNAQQIDQDGASVTYKRTGDGSGAGHAITLAPLAARALKNLSWKRSRSTRRHPMPDHDSTLRGIAPWRPMGRP
ncbi:hypothetical protein [Streptomyces sp. ST2-7A]|uniref:hypothetical protein n=1 Tax=Streptomyces sp. ST2-7A TaxID=2907214 RepID=UPI001F2145AB|nr:hypothetical protein [Streptomyces sp. ST2-7A]MCE7081157.1 hypothetical protein [Streptomyces sp. ST2-7A]